MASKTDNAESFPIAAGKVVNLLPLTENLVKEERLLISDGRLVIMLFERSNSAKLLSCEISGGTVVSRLFPEKMRKKFYGI